MKQELNSVANELRAIHSRLIEIKKELQSLLKRNSPHAFSLLEVHVLQDQLRDIDSAKIDGKFINRQGVIINGQAQICDLIESCYDDVHELLSAKDVVVADNPLRHVYENLIRIRAKLESHQITFRWSLSPVELHELQRSLADIDNMRVDGKFLDEQGNVPEGQAILHFLLHKCYRLSRKLVNSLEIISDQWTPQYNQLITLKKCLLELKKWRITLSDRECIPYAMKLQVCPFRL